MIKKWWQDKIAYQIYPKSFMDSNGDGIGDIPGVISKIDYLKELGVDILWLSPCYPSPLADEGYDISDYYNIDPRFGSLEDMDRLIAEAKKRDMHIVLDLVVNHCSDEHEWFRQACKDPEGKYGKYFYLRRKREDGKLPTNWRSYFGGSVWEELPGQPDYYYLHVFHKKQPDLNWENPEVREEVYKNVNWWLDRGVDGFRIDAIINIKKPMLFADYEVDRGDGLSGIGNMLEEAQGIGVFLRELQDRTFALHDAFSVGEVFNEKKEEIPAFIGENGYFSSMFDFEETIFGGSDKGWYDRKPCLPEDYKQCVFRRQSQIGQIGYVSNIIENHDEPRGVSRYIPGDQLNDKSKKALATAYFLLRGIPFIYQGQELGQENKSFRSFDELDDISSIDEYKVAREAGLTDREALDVISEYSRDNARTPVQWTAGEHAGFTSGKPWLEPNENYTRINAEAQEKDPESVLNYYRSLSKLRKDPAYHETLSFGSLTPWKAEQKNMMAYLRQYEGQTILVAINMQEEEQRLELPSAVKSLLMTNEPGMKVDVKTKLKECENEITLSGWQALVTELV